jgi:peptide/nickel transport system substrate-binding protein
VYTFQMRRDVKWQDGQPFTAKDVEWSYKTLADPANKLLGGPSFSTMASIAAPDDFTLQITTKEPDVELLEKLTESATAIMPKHAFDRGDNFEKVAIGTGAFKIESNDPQKGVVYVPNPTYWRSGQPYVAKFRLLPATDEAGRTAAFIAGQNDVLKLASRPQAESVLAQVSGAKHAPFFRDNTSDLFLKLDRPPFNDLRVRQAINLVTDRQEMINTLTQGDGLVNPPGINPIRKAWAIPAAELAAMPGYQSKKELDVARAKQLLGEAGYSNGLSFTIRFDRVHPDRPSLSEMMSEQLRQAGVSAKLQPQESASFQKAFLDGEYEAAMYTGNAPDNWRQQIHSGATLNRMPLNDPELDRLIDSQAREFDPAKRAQTILDLQRLLLRQTYVIPTITLVGYLMWQPYVHGWVDNQAANIGNLDWAQLWLDGAPASR